jgi:hypothetical protein
MKRSSPSSTSSSSAQTKNLRSSVQVRTGASFRPQRSPSHKVSMLSCSTAEVNSSEGLLTSVDDISVLDISSSLGISFNENDERFARLDVVRQLTVENWSLKKVILELNCLINKSKKDLKTSNHLIKNLQGLSTSSQSENFAKCKENSELKQKIIEVEKKNEELVSQLQAATSSLIKQKKSVFSLQQKLQETDRLHQVKSKTQ